MSKAEKYGLIGIGVVLVILIIVSCVIKVDKKEKELSNDANVVLENAQAESAAVVDDEKSEFNQIDINQYLEMYNGSEKQLILIARPTCGYCQIAEPIIQNLMYEHNIEINYLNTDNFSEEDDATLVKSDELFSSGYGTPTLIVVGNGGIISNVDGLTDTAHYEKFFKENGFIE